MISYLHLSESDFDFTIGIIADAVNNFIVIAIPGDLSIAELIIIKVM